MLTLLLAGCTTSTNKTLSTNEVMQKLASYSIDVTSDIAYYCYQGNVITQHYFYQKTPQNNVFVYTYAYDDSDVLQQFRMELPPGGNTLDTYVANFYTDDKVIFDSPSLKIGTIVNPQDLLIDLDSFYDFALAKMITTEFNDTSIHLVYSVGDKYIDLTEKLQNKQIVFVEEREYSNKEMTELTRISITTSTPPKYQQMMNQSKSLINADISETLKYNEFE